MMGIDTLYAGYSHPVTICRKLEANLSNYSTFALHIEILQSLGNRMESELSDYDQLKTVKKNAEDKGEEESFRFGGSMWLNRTLCDILEEMRKISKGMVVVPSKAIHDGEVALRGLILEAEHAGLKMHNALIAKRLDEKNPRLKAKQLEKEAKEALPVVVAESHWEVLEQQDEGFSNAMLGVVIGIGIFAVAVITLIMSGALQ